MRAIVNVDRNWGIGREGKLLQRIPEDMRRFRSITTGKVVVMGRATLESLPDGKPLKDRVNIVLTGNRDLSAPGATVCGSLEELFRELLKYPDDEVYVIGGGSVYRQLLPYCAEAYVTKLDNIYEADVSFVDLDREAKWELTWESEIKCHDGVRFRFTSYRNNGVLARRVV